MARPRYDNFKEATGYGTGEGLGGYNCRHSFYPYFEELGEQTYEHFDEQQNAKQYALEQKQRYYERKVREWDRRKRITDAAGIDSTKETLKLTMWSTKLSDLTKSLGYSLVKPDFGIVKSYTRDVIKKSLGEITQEPVENERTKNAKFLDDLEEHTKSLSSKDEDLKKLAKDIGGITPEKLEQKLNDSLQSIVQDCDVGMRISTENLKKVLTELDGHFKNMFETGTSDSDPDIKKRIKAEFRAFGSDKNTKGENRATYGMMIPKVNGLKDTDAIKYLLEGPGSWYGNNEGCTVVLKKNEIINNATFTTYDSLVYKTTYGSELCKPKFAGNSAFTVSSAKALIDDTFTTNQKLINALKGYDKYMEVQIFGRENHNADTVEKVYLSARAYELAERNGLLDILKSSGIPYVKIE